MSENNIVRSKTTAQGKFTMIPNHICRSQNLTMDERGLLIYLLSLPENWMVRKTQVQTQMVGMGRNRYEKAFSSLEKQGYILKIQHFKGNLKSGITYVVYENPVTQVSGAPETREVENRRVENLHTTNTDNTKTEVIKTNNKNNNNNSSSTSSSTGEFDIPLYLLEPSNEINELLKQKGIL